MQGDVFEADEPGDDGADTGERMLVDLEGFEGPLDVLLTLAREQKVASGYNRLGMMSAAVSFSIRYVMI